MKNIYYLGFATSLLVVAVNYFTTQGMTQPNIPCNPGECSIWQLNSPYGGYYLGHSGPMGMSISSSPSTSTQSVFMISDQGLGYQAEVKPGSAAISSSGPNTGTIACQQPFGYPISCVSKCNRFPTPGLIQSNCTGPVINALPVPAASNIPPLDFLNENHTKPATATTGVFLSSIVNNSGSSYEFATTTAPLYGIVYDSTTSAYGVDPNTIAGAIAAGTLNIFNDIYDQKPSGSITVGGKQFAINFIGESASVKDNRYVLAPASQHNPAADSLALKVNMADPNLSLDVSPAGPGNQTIILFPSRMQTTCQPVIFIGRDKDNVFYALTYLGAYTSISGQQCCVSSSGTLCSTDMIYPSNDPTNLSGSVVTNSSQSDPNFIRIGSSGRLAVNIQCIAKTGGYGYASSITSAKGLWTPGQSGSFPNIPVAPTVCTS